MHQDHSQAGVAVTPATVEQEPILANLLELYCHDFSEFQDVRLGPDGRFGYPHLPLYWREPGRYPFLLRVDGELAGLIFVKQGSTFSSRPEVWDMAEFFVVRGQRRRGLGTIIAHQIWRRFPGSWEVRVMETNTAAGCFWQQAIAKFAGESFSSDRVLKDGRRWLVFSFVAGVSA